MHQQLPQVGHCLPNSVMALLMLSIFAFVGLVWWVVGRIMRWAFYKIARGSPTAL
jgi:hypothetical protein